MRISGILLGLALTTSAAAQAETVTIPVRNAAIVHDDLTGEDAIDVTLSADGRRSLAAFTGERVGRIVHLRVDGVLLTSPTVRSPIDNGALRLSPGVSGLGGMSAEEIVKRLNARGVMEVSDDE